MCQHSMTTCSLSVDTLKERCVCSQCYCMGTLPCPCKPITNEAQQLTEFHTFYYYSSQCDIVLELLLVVHSHTSVSPEPPYSVSISGSSTVGYNQRLSLTCSVSGIVSTYQWYHNGVSRDSSTSRYYSKSAQSSDSGSYKCKACNWAGCTGYSSTLRVTVIG